MFGRLLYKYLLKVFLSPLFIAIIVGVASYYGYFQKAINKYDYQVLDIQNTDNKKNYYVDLDNDGITEKILLGHLNNTFSHSFITLYKDPIGLRTTLTQFNFDLPYVKSSSMIFADIDNDNHKELFFFSLHDSCVFLNGFKYDVNSINILSPLFTDRKIAKINLKEDIFEDFIICDPKVLDFNNDGYKDIVFFINGMYSAYPRQLFIYDAKNDCLILTSDKYHFSVLRISAIKNQKTTHAFFLPTCISVPMNIGDSSMKYNDRYSWVVVFNDSLQPLFEPIKLGYGFGSTNYQLYYSHENTEGVLSLSIKNDNKTLTLYSMTGDTLNQKFFDCKHALLLPSIDNNKYACSILTGQQLIGISHDFKVELIANFGNYESEISNFKFINMDKDPEKEMFLINNFNREIQFYDNDFSKIISFPNEDLGYVINVQHILSKKNKDNFIFLSGDKKNELIKFYKNKYYILAFAFPLLISVIFYIIIYFSLKQREKAIQQKHQREKDLIEAQLKIANKQMSPHFQLNVLNSISYLFENNKDKAQYYLGKYSRLVTNTMINVDKISTTIENELDFTKNYLTLEQLRLQFKFDFDINIDDQVNMQLQIPRMLIFTFCENAVKHGLFHKKDKGKLNVEILQKDSKHIEITITDNGIGRSKATQIDTKGTGMGLKTLDKIITHFNSLGNTKINYTIIDKLENKGMEVRIIIETK